MQSLQARKLTPGPIFPLGRANSENKAPKHPSRQWFSTEGQKETSTHQGTFAMSRIMEVGMGTHACTGTGQNYLAPMSVRVEVERPCLRPLNNF